MRKNKYQFQKARAVALAFCLSALSITACAGKDAQSSSAQSSAESTSDAAEAASDTAASESAAFDGSAQADAASKAESASSGAAASSETEAASETAASSEAAFKAASVSADASVSKNTELFAMDTVMTLTAYGPNAQAGLDAATAEIKRLDSLFSISSETGDIFRVNRDGKGDLSDDSAALLSRALDFAKVTGGLFEPTIEPVMQAWGFTTKNFRVPSDDELKSLLANVDYTRVSLSGSHVELPEGVQLDLGGIAKGFTSARVMDVFKKAGVTSGIISLGGNVQALGTKPDGSLWRVGIQDPNNLNDTFAVVEVADEAVITSGAYQRFFEENGKTYHHIIDPRTGYPSDSGLTSVSIISKDGTLADALSTSLFIMGADAAADFWKAHSNEFDTVMMDKDGTVYVTAGLADRCRITGGKQVSIIQ